MITANVPVLKAQLTREWRSGKYKDRKDFIAYLEDFCKTNKISGMDYAVYYAGHVDHLFSTQPNPIKSVQIKKIKREHDKWYVYFYFSGPALYYIGKTYDIEARYKQHCAEDEKYKTINHILYMEFNCESDALDFERYYTRHLQPVWNISNKEPASRLYKLPEQQIRPWIKDSHSIEEARKAKAELDYCYTSLVPILQCAIHDISA